MSISNDDTELPKFNTIRLLRNKADVVQSVSGVLDRFEDDLISITIIGREKSEESSAETVITELSADIRFQNSSEEPQTT